MGIISSPENLILQPDVVGDPVLRWNHMDDGLPINWNQKERALVNARLTNQSVIWVSGIVAAWSSLRPTRYTISLSSRVDAYSTRVTLKFPYLQMYLQVCWTWESPCSDFWNFRLVVKMVGCWSLVYWLLVLCHTWEVLIQDREFIGFGIGMESFRSVGSLIGTKDVAESQIISIQCTSLYNCTRLIYKTSSVTSAWCFPVISFNFRGTIAKITDPSIYPRSAHIFTPPLPAPVKTILLRIIPPSIRTFAVGLRIG